MHCTNAIGRSAALVATHINLKRIEDENMLAGLFGNDRVAEVRAKLQHGEKLRLTKQREMRRYQLWNMAEELKVDDGHMPEADEQSAAGVDDPLARAAF